MTGFTNIFGGSPVQPSDIAYEEISLTSLNSPYILTWPTSFVDTAQVVARIMNITSTQIALGANPLATAAASAVITVTIASTVGFTTGQNIQISGAIGFDGITADQLNIIAPIIVTGGTTFTYVSNGIATAGISGGGGAVTYALGGPYSITLPDAREVSVGADFLVFNIGLNPFNVNSANGTNLQLCAPGIAYYFWLTDNTTLGGTWSVIVFGAGTSIADSNALAGNGLVSIFGKLNTNFPSKNISASYVATTADRAYLLVWTGGTGTITMPSPAPLGYYLAVNNEGSGTVTIQTSDGSLIDGSSTFALNPSNTSYFISTVNGWNSLGFGQRSIFSVTVLPPLDISAGGNITLTSQQASKNIEQFTGNLAQNATIIYPAVPGIWEVFNSTTGAFTVSATVTGSGSSVIIPQGGSFVIYSDGSKMYIVGAPGVPAFPLTVPNGGTGDTSFTAYALIAGGTTSTNPLQSIAGVGSLGQYLISNGAGALPTWQDLGSNANFTPYAVITGPTVAGGPLQNVVGLGSAGFSLTSNGAGALPTWQSNSMKSVQVFTTGTGATYTKPAGVNNILVELIGAGAGGGGMNVTTTTGSAAGGGAAGGYCRKFIAGASATYTYTVGAGGAGGTAGANPGTAGGNTTFGALTAFGGTGGAAGVAKTTLGISGVAVAGGAATGGDLNIGGENGDAGIIYNSLAISGAGGASYFTVNGGQVTVTSGAAGVGQGAGGYGCGGSGASGSGVNSNQAGGIGFGGVIFVWEFS